MFRIIKHRGIGGIDMTKNEKIAILANCIVMLNQTSEHRNPDIYKIAEQIGFLANGNPRFALLSCIGAEYEDVREVVMKELNEQKILTMEDNKK
jgi:hypothetical protein